MPVPVLTFTLVHGLDSVPVVAEPYDTLSARALAAIAPHGDLVDGVTMPAAVHAELYRRHLVAMGFVTRLGVTVPETFLGRKITVDHAEQ